MFPLSVGRDKCTISVECASVSLRDRMTETHGIRDLKIPFYIDSQKRPLIFLPVKNWIFKIGKIHWSPTDHILGIRSIPGLSTKARRKHTWQLRGERERVTYREPSEREKLQWTVKQRFQLIPPNARRHTHKPNTLCMVFLPEVGR